jgi:hypothetical protein
VTSTKKIFILGATGWIGRSLSLKLLGNGYSLIAAVRDQARARMLLGAEVTIIPWSMSDEELVPYVDGCEAVINLAGAPIAEGRWTRKRQGILRSSRIDVTKRLVSIIEKTESKPDCFLSASAVGYYGDTKSEVTQEITGSGTGFLAEICKDWETAALEAESLGVRVVLPRIGIVLGKGGGMLGKVTPVFRAGLGGRLGSGTQYMPWIHLSDLIESLIHVIKTPSIKGPFVSASPYPITNRAFTGELAKALHRPAFIPAPIFILKMVLGEMSGMLLNGQRLQPEKLLNSGFVFEFEHIQKALSAIFAVNNIQITRVGKEELEPQIRNDNYLKKRPARYVLRAFTKVPTSIGETFSFFSRPENLGVLTPPNMAFELPEVVPTMESGALIDYKIRLGKFPMTWRTRIACWKHETLFVDSQERGPYASWWHEHHFTYIDGETVMEDRVFYSPPMGLLGRIVNTLYISQKLKRIFSYRAEAIEMRFGSQARND